MSEVLTLLDQALEIGHKELGFLVDGDVEEARQLAQGRDELTARAMNDRDGVNLDLVLAKLSQLQNLQGQITQEARRLHEALKQDLQRARRENRRFAGYRDGSRPAPLTTSRFISRQG